MNDLYNIIEKKIADLIIKSQDFKEISKQKDIYCPFEALSVSKTEIRHSNFLADIINPNRPHGFGDRCFKVFVGGLLEAANETCLHLSFILDEATDIQIRREWNHIDLLIILSHKNLRQQLVIAIELKIDANESNNQLNNYGLILNEHFQNSKILKFFLSPYEKEASQSDWISVTLQTFIEGWSEVIQSGQGTSKARMMLESYIFMIKRKFMANPDLEQIAQKIWSKHRDALEYLIEQQPNPATEILTELASKDFLSKINLELQKKYKDIEIIVDRKSARFLHYAFQNWDNIPQMKRALKWTDSNRILLYEIEASSNSITSRFVLGRGEYSIRNEIYNSLSSSKKIDLKRKRKGITNDFTRMSSFQLVNKEKLNLIISESIDETEMKKIKEKFLKEILNTFPLYNEVIKETFKSS